MDAPREYGCVDRCQNPEVAQQLPHESDEVKAKVGGIVVVPPEILVTLGGERWVCVCGDNRVDGEVEKICS
jgi:hypothetical protein